MEKILVYENEKEISDLHARVRQAHRAYNAVYQAYQELDIPLEIKTVEDLLNLANDPDGVIRKSYLAKMPKTLEWGGVKVRQEAVSSHIVMPDLTNLKNASVQVVRSLRHPEEKFTEFELFHISGKEITIDEEELENEANRFRIYATTEEEIARYKVLQALCDKLNEAKEYYGKRFSNTDRLEDELRCIVKKGLKYVPNYKFIKY